MTRIALTLTALVLALGLQTAAQSGAAVEKLFASAQHKETTEGDLRGAIALYEQVVAQAGTNRTLAANALLRMAEAHQRLGNADARSIYDRVSRDFADQPEVASAARTRLAARPGQNQPASVAPRLLCDQCGNQYARIDAEGRLMFTMSEDGYIGVRDLMSGAMTPLRIPGAAPRTAFAPVPSPDLRQVAYAWGPQYGGNVELRVIGRETGSQPRILVRNPEYPYLQPAAWTSEGTVVAVAQRPDRTWEILRVSTSDGRIATLKSLGWRLADPIRAVSLSPDGRYLAYAAVTVAPSGPITQRQAATMEWQVYVLALDGSSETAVTTGAGIKTKPIWSADGRHVLYRSDVSGTWDLWAAPVRSGQPGDAPVLVRSDVGTITGVGVTRSGEYHFYQEHEGVRQSSVVRIAENPPARTNVVHNVVGQLPRWSPDGQLLSLVRAATAGAPAAHVVVRNLATAAERVYRSQPVAQYPSLWSSDGRSLLVLTRRVREQRSWLRLDLDTGQFHELTALDGNPGVRVAENVRTLAPDDRTLYLAAFRSGDVPEGIDRIVALDLMTGAYRDVFRLPADDRSLPRRWQDLSIAVSPDGRTLAVAYFDRAANGIRLGTVGVDGRAWRQLTAPVQLRYSNNGLHWSRDGRWIYFATAEDGERERGRIQRIAVEGGAVQHTGVEVDGLESFHPSPDGTRIAFSSFLLEGARKQLWTLDLSAILSGR